MLNGELRAEFNDVVDFHGCYCLDIAMGYRIAKALVREMGEHMANMKQVEGYYGTSTCAVDALQKLTGCTFGKRNLHYTHTGKHVFALQNTVTGKAVRAYVHYWDGFDHGALRAAKKAANDPQDGSVNKRAAFKAMLDEKMEHILTADESELFKLTEVSLATPVKSGKYVAQPCECCGEHANVALLVDHSGVRICRECDGSH